MNGIIATRARGDSRKKWVAHGAHLDRSAPYLQGSDSLSRSPTTAAAFKPMTSDQDEIQLDGGHGEGGGQILRTALTLSLLTGKPFRIERIRANRAKPGLRAQHLAAVDAARRLGRARVEGMELGSSNLVFEPEPYEAMDLTIGIGTAGATGLILHTLALPLAIKAEAPVRLTLQGGTFNLNAPSYPFLETTWAAYQRLMGLPARLEMRRAGFYPWGGGELVAQLAPGRPTGLNLLDRGPLKRIKGVAGVCGLDRSIARRMRRRVEAKLESLSVVVEIEEIEWPSQRPGVAIALVAEHEQTIPATFVSLGERGKPSEAVADEVVKELLAFEAVPAAVDPHSADQLLLPLVWATAGSSYTVSHVTEHLRTNVATIRAFLDREIRVEESADDTEPGRVTIGPI